VATRKLRSGLDVFHHCITPEKYGIWYFEVKRATKILGKVRDLDVQIDFLTKFLKELNKPRYEDGINRLKLRLKQQRIKRQAKIENAMEELQKSDLFGSFRGRAKYQMTEIRPGNSHISANIFDKIYINVNECIANSMELDAAIYFPDRIEELHELRKRNKKLRYTLEIFSPLFGTEMRDHINKITVIHDLAGLIHDSDVWIDFIPKFIEAEKLRTKEYFGNIIPFKMIKPGLDYLLRNRKRVRDEDYEKFIAIWSELKKENFWNKILETIDNSKKESIGSGINVSPL
jgi:CHAD domain-containing protein